MACDSCWQKWKTSINNCKKVIEVTICIYHIIQAIHSAYSTLLLLSCHELPVGSLSLFKDQPIKISGNVGVVFMIGPSKMKSLCVFEDSLEIQTAYQLGAYCYHGPQGMVQSAEIFILKPAVTLLHKTVIVLLWQRLGSGDAQTKSHSPLPGAILFFFSLLLLRTYSIG